MIYAVIALIIFFVYRDALWLYRYNQEAYEQLIQIPPVRIAVYSGLLFVGALPIYLIRRLQFSKIFFKRSLEENFLSFDATGVLLSWFSIVLIIESLCKLVELAFGLELRNSLSQAIGFVIFETMLMVLLIVLKGKHYPGGFKQLISWRKPQISIAVANSLAVFMGISFAFLGAMVLLHRTITPTTPLTEMLDANDSPRMMGLFIGMALLMAPFAEEIVFRGFFFNSLKRIMKAPYAIAIIALIFAGLHVQQYWSDWMAIAVVTIVGFGLTLLRYKTDSVIPSVIMHYTYNACVVIIPVIWLVVYNPSFILYMEGQASLGWEKKISLLQESIKTNPQFTDGYYYLALEYYQRKERLNEALKLIEQALILSPQRSVYLQLKSDILYELEGDSLLEQLKKGDKFKSK